MSRELCRVRERVSTVDGIFSADLHPRDPGLAVNVSKPTTGDISYNVQGALTLSLLTPVSVLTPSLS